MIRDKKDEFVRRNEEASTKYCEAELEQLSVNLLESISAGIFSVPGGYELYMEAKDRIERDYWQVPRKGVKVRNKGSIGILLIKVKRVS